MKKGTGKRILFLDDRSKRLHSALEKFGKDVTLVVTVKECIKMLSNEEWDEVYLDHDLGFREFVNSNMPDCGMEVVRYLVDHYKTLRHLYGTNFICHSSNRTARLEMQEALLEGGWMNAFEQAWEY